METQSVDDNVVAEAKLLFELKNPSYDDVWLEGYELALEEGEEEANPYEVGSTEHEFWTEGWWAGFYGEEPLFDLDGNVLATEEKVDSPVTKTAESKASIGHRIRAVGRLAGGLMFGGALAAMCYDLMM